MNRLNEPPKLPQPQKEKPIQKEKVIFREIPLIIEQIKKAHQ